MALTRVRCNVCHQYPTLTKEGALRNHAYPWYHSQAGTPCPGSGSQVTPLAGQLTLEETRCDDSQSHS